MSEQDLKLLAQQVEEKLRSTGVSTVSSEEVGKTVLPFLSALDEIAYLRFASVYRSFNTLNDFEDAIAHLRQQKDGKDNIGQTDDTSVAPVAKPERLSTLPNESDTESEDSSVGYRSPVAKPPAANRNKPAAKKAGSKRKPREEEPTLLDQ